MRSHAAFRARYGPWALVTGAAQGLGAEFARQLAARGLRLVLVDCEAAPLAERVGELKASHGVELEAVVVDLSGPDFLASLGPLLDDLEIGLLVSSAARSPIGRFLEQPLPELDAVLQLNCRAPLVLSHELGHRMLSRGRGGLILVSSLSGRRGTPLVAHYAATKAYNQILGEGLWAELREQGIDVLALAPGVTDTPGFERSQPERNSLPGRLVQDCPAVVAEALGALGRTPSLVPGRANRLASLVLERLLPRRAAIRLLGDNMRKLYPKR